MKRKNVVGIIIFLVLLSLIGLLYYVEKEDNNLKTKINAIRKEEESYPVALKQIKVTEEKKRKEYHPYWDTIYKAGDEYADIYSLSYQKSTLKKGSILKYKKDASKELLALLKSSYPYVSLDKTKDDQFDSLQLAIWNLAYRTNESKTKKSLEDMVEELGEEKIKDNVLERAKNYITLAEKLDTDTMKIKPTLEFTSNDLKWNLKDQKRIVGPFVYDSTCMEKEIIDVIVESENGNRLFFTVVDEDGKKIEDLTKTSTFYISLDQDYLDFRVQLKIDYYYLRAAIYEDEKKEEYLLRTYTKSNKKKAIRVHIRTDEDEEEEGETESMVIEA